MARVQTNNTSLQVAVESSTGTLPGTPLWKLLQPNTISTYGADITTEARNPISNNRRAQKGTTIDLDSSVELEMDLTRDHILEFVEGFCFASFQNPTVIVRLASGANFDNLDVTSDAYTHDALSSALAEDTLIYVRGFSTSANNGLKEVAAGSTTTTTEVEETLGADETPTEVANAQLDVAGFRFADLTWTDATNTLGTSADDFTTLGLSAGQFIRIGSGTNDFGNGAAYARIVSIAATTMVVDKVVNIGSGTLDGGGDQTAAAVDLLYGRFCKDVDTDNASYLERTFQFEAVYADLESVGTDAYEYAIGNFANSLAINVSETSFATMTVGFLGTDAEAVTTTRKTNAANGINPQGTTAYSSSSDVARIRVTDTSETDIAGTCFTDMTLTLNNNVTVEKCIGTLGAVFVNAGNFDVTIEGTAVFFDKALPNAIRNNTTVTMELIVENDDGGFALDIPSMTLGGGDKEFPENESVDINFTGSAFEDATLGTAVSFSFFPYLP